MTKCNDKSSCDDKTSCDDVEDCLVLNIELPPVIQYGGIEIDIAVVEQSVPQVDITDPDSVYNLVPLPMTYRQLHKMFYSTNNEFTLNRNIISDGEQSVYKNTLDPFKPWNTHNNPMMDITDDSPGGRNMRMLDLITFNRHHYMAQQGPPVVIKQFSLYKAVLGLYEKCLGNQNCWDPCTKVEFEKYISSIKNIFDLDMNCDKVECSLTLDELFSMLDEAGYDIEEKTGMPYAQGNNRYPAPDLSGNKPTLAQNTREKGYAWSYSQSEPALDMKKLFTNEAEYEFKVGDTLTQSAIDGATAVSSNPYVSKGDRKEARGVPAVPNTLEANLGGNLQNPEVAGKSHPPIVRNMPMITIVVVFKSCTPGVSDLQIRMNYLLDFQPANNLPMILDSNNKTPIMYPSFYGPLNYWGSDKKARYSFDNPYVGDDYAIHIEEQIELKEQPETEPSGQTNPTIEIGPSGETNPSGQNNSTIE